MARASGRRLVMACLCLCLGGASSAYAQAAKDPAREEALVEQTEDKLIDKMGQEFEKAGDSVKDAAQAEVDADETRIDEAAQDAASPSPPQPESLNDLEREVDQLEQTEKREHAEAEEPDSAP